MRSFAQKKYRINKKEFIFERTNTQFYSFFSGCGGLDIGAILNKYSVISSLDNDSDSIETLKRNKVFGQTEHDIEDIRNIDSRSIAELIEKNQASHAYFLGGPPCQPFSKAGYWQTHKKRKGHKDPKNMIDPYLDIIQEVKPDGFILENVESILHPKNRGYLEHIQNRICRMNYNLEVFKLNAADFGIPQKRKRVFFIAKKGQIFNCLETTHGDDKATSKNPRLKHHERVIDWIGEYDDQKYSDGYDSIEGTYKNELKEIPAGKNYMHLTERDNHPNPKFIAGKRYWTFLLKLDPNKPSNTIISAPGHWEGPFHWKNRRLRIKELAAIQSFPCDYNFFGSRRSIIKQIGNAVPPLLAKKVVKSLIEEKN